MVNAVVSNAGPCPACKAVNLHLWRMLSIEQPGRVAIGCTECGYIGDDASTLAAAVDRWNTAPAPQAPASDTSMDRTECRRAYSRNDLRTPRRRRVRHTIRRHCSRFTRAIPPPRLSCEPCPLMGSRNVPHKKANAARMVQFPHGRRRRPVKAQAHGRSGKTLRRRWDLSA